MNTEHVTGRSDTTTTLGEVDYIEQRLDHQIRWFSKESQSNQAAYKRLRVVEITAAAGIPLLAGFGRDSPVLILITGILGLVVAVIAGVVGLYRFQELWVEYRSVAETLKQEKFLYLSRVAPYASDQRFDLLVHRVEIILRNERTDWVQAMHATSVVGKAGIPVTNGSPAVAKE